MVKFVKRKVYPSGSLSLLSQNNIKSTQKSISKALDAATAAWKAQFKQWAKIRTCTVENGAVSHTVKHYTIAMYVSDNFSIVLPTV